MSPDCGTGYLPRGYNSQKAHSFCLPMADNSDIFLASGSECRGPLEMVQRKQKRLLPSPSPYGESTTIKLCHKINASFASGLRASLCAVQCILTVLNDELPSAHKLCNVPINKCSETSCVFSVSFLFLLFLSSAGNRQGYAKALPVPTARRQWCRALMGPSAVSRFWQKTSVKH